MPSRTNQYLKSHFSESIRFNVYDRIPETSANQWLQMATDFGTMEVPRCPLHPRLRAPLMQDSFPLSFRKKWRKLSTNTSILPSTLEDHHEPDSGTVQSNKELVVKKNSFQNEKKGYKRIQ